jgi:hypothetical protein
MFGFGLIAAIGNFGILLAVVTALEGAFTSWKLSSHSLSHGFCTFLICIFPVLILLISFLLWFLGPEYLLSEIGF